MRLGVFSEKSIATAHNSGILTMAFSEIFDSEKEDFVRCLISASDGYIFMWNKSTN
jgi:hypothetical protein